MCVRAACLPARAASRCDPGRVSAVDDRTPPLRASPRSEGLDRLRVLMATRHGHGPDQLRGAGARRRRRRGDRGWRAVGRQPRSPPRSRCGWPRTRSRSRSAASRSACCRCVPTVAVVVIAQLGARWSARKLGGRFRMDAGPVLASIAGAHAAVAVLGARCCPGRPKWRRRRGRRCSAVGWSRASARSSGCCAPAGFPRSGRSASRTGAGWVRAARPSRSWRCSAWAR